MAGFQVSPEGGTANPGSWNRFAYVENDPLGLIDPRGLQKQKPGIPYYYLDCWGEDRPGCALRIGVTVSVTEQEDLPTVDSKTAAGLIKSGVSGGKMSDCQGLALYAKFAAENYSSSTEEFIASFGVFVPSDSGAVRFANQMGYNVYSSNDHIEFAPPNGNSGFKAEYQDNNYWEDQAHYFSAYFILGTRAGSTLGSIAAYLNDINNPGDQRLVLLR